MERRDTAFRDELKTLLAPLYDMDWSADETKCLKAKTLFAQYFDLALDDVFRDREESSYQEEDRLVKQVASRMNEVLSALKVTSNLGRNDAGEGDTSQGS